MKCRFPDCHLNLAGHKLVPDTKATNQKKLFFTTAYQNAMQLCTGASPHLDWPNHINPLTIQAKANISYNYHCGLVLDFLDATININNLDA